MRLFFAISIFLLISSAFSHERSPSLNKRSFTLLYLLYKPHVNISLTRLSRNVPNLQLVLRFSKTVAYSVMDSSAPWRRQKNLCLTIARFTFGMKCSLNFFVNSSYFTTFKSKLNELNICKESGPIKCSNNATFLFSASFSILDASI